MKRAAPWAVVLACVWAQPVFADTRVVVRSFAGQGGEAVRDAVVQSVAEGDGLQMVTNKQVDSVAGTLNADLATEAGRVAVARALSISAFVEGNVQNQGATTTLTLRVYDGRDGALLTDAAIQAQPGAIEREVRKRFIAELGRAIREGQPPPMLEPLPPPPAPPAPALQTTPVATPALASPEPAKQTTPAQGASEPETESTAPERQALELGAGLLALSRSYAYRDALLKMPEHTGAATPALRLGARWYPAAHATENFLGNLGLEGDVQVMWPSDATQGNTKFTTTATELGIGGRARFPIAEHELGLSMGYGVQSFAIGGANGQDPGIPKVSYSSVRLGADGRFRVQQVLELQLRLAYLALTGFGELGESAWFSHVSGGGLNLQLSLGFDVNKALALTVSGGTTRYFMSLDPHPTDSGVSHGRIAGGLTDQYVYGMFGILVRPY